jgi:hypothetical protein
MLSQCGHTGECSQRLLWPEWERDGLGFRERENAVQLAGVWANDHSYLVLVEIWTGLALFVSMFFVALDWNPGLHICSESILPLSCMPSPPALLYYKMQTLWPRILAPITLSQRNNSTCVCDVISLRMFSVALLPVCAISSTQLNNSRWKPMLPRVVVTGHMWLMSISSDWGLL